MVKTQEIKNRLVKINKISFNEKGVSLTSSKVVQLFGEELMYVSDLVTEFTPILFSYGWTGY